MAKRSFLVAVIGGYVMGALTGAVFGSLGVVYMLQEPEAVLEAPQPTYSRPKLIGVVYNSAAEPVSPPAKELLAPPEVEAEADAEPVPNDSIKEMIEFCKKDKSDETECLADNIRAREDTIGRAHQQLLAIQLAEFATTGFINAFGNGRVYVVGSDDVRVKKLVKRAVVLAETFKTEVLWGLKEETEKVLSGNR